MDCLLLKGVVRVKNKEHPEGGVNKDQRLKNMAKILTTDAYKTFKLIKGNRPISKKKVDKIIASYKSGIDLFPYCPILVNKDHYVIEGQHRLSACTILNINVHYIIVPDFSLQQIAELNSNTDKWKNIDFLNCYIKTGKKDYVTLKSFKEDYNLSFGVAVMILMTGNCKDQSGPQLMEKFRSGTFSVNHYDRALNIMKKSLDYRDVFSKCHSRQFLSAIQMLLASKSYVHSEVIAKLCRNKEEIQMQKSPKDYIAHIEQLYNKGNSKRQIIWT